MQRSLSQRLAALEAQHGPPTHPGALTAADCAMLLVQLGLSNVRLERDGRAVRSWRCSSADATAAIDRALLRLNAMLAVHPVPPSDTTHLAYGLARYVEKAHA
jgi:hypothetical protein